MAGEQSNPKNQFQETLNLPQTEFSIRANAQIKEPEILKRWEATDLAQQATEKNAGNDKFILHFGPPYANGHLHLGHALTYILKDIVCKAKRMSGLYAPLVPGWDCHGLPIEQKVSAEKGLEKTQGSVDRLTFKKYCRDYARNWITVQKNEMEGFGKLVDFKNAYQTMSPEYEAAIARALAVFVEKGFIERKLKTVPWCHTCQTVLAVAEIEYNDRKDPSIYVAFRVPDARARLIFPFLFETYPSLVINLAVWTTTPWTLPLNRAVTLNPSAVYVVLRGKEPNHALIVAQECADNVCQALGIEKVVLAECDSVVFDGTKVMHPFIHGLEVPVILDPMVQLDDGTACVHCAPGCGPEDYLMAVKKGLEVYSPLSADGRYTKGILPASLEGVSIADGQKLVLQMLVDNGALIHKASITHSYPHCWRCHNGLMFRATNQWFCDLAKNDLVGRALKSLDDVTFVPERGRARLHAFVANRTEWCISRQRQWGVPIPGILCSQCGAGWITADFVRSVADFFAKEGIEWWDRMMPQELVALSVLPKDFSCSCGNKDINSFVLDRDILDVWFESGISSFAVLAQDPERLGVPADMYFEGSDQHRGWFQSSLLAGVVLYGYAPMRCIASHGFIIDEQKRKMSKSLGNVVAPDEIIKKYSRDILRLWVASIDYEDDIVISDKVLSNLSEVYRKIRNTCRFLLANLYDFDISKDAIEIAAMWPIDQYALSTLFDLDVKVRKAYDEYRFASAIQAVNEYCTNTLSAVYLDILKDRLYVEVADGSARRSAQTAMYHILDGVTKLVAPVLSFLAEEVSDFYQKDKIASIHLQDFSVAVDVWKHLGTIAHNASTGLCHQAQWTALEMLRGAVLKAIEIQRVNGVIKHSYEAHVALYLDPNSDQHALIAAFTESLQQAGHDVERFFKDWFVVSAVVFKQAREGLEPSLVPWLYVAVQHADGTKCPRCWRWDASQGLDGLCRRCQCVLGR